MLSSYLKLFLVTDMRISRFLHNSTLALLSLISLLLSFFIVPGVVLAQKIEASPSPVASSSASPGPTTMNSNELFWPLSAGKTIDDKFYFLKEFKEKLRGWFIFGEAQKADYSVFLGTKRVLEAEKLLDEGKHEFANQTFDKALEQFESAQKNIEEASGKKMLFNDSVMTMKPRLNNLTDLLPTLESDKANEVLQKVTDLRTKL